MPTEKAKIDSTIDEVCIKVHTSQDCEIWVNPEVMILSKYVLTKIANATKMNSKCLYIHM